jgi:hypothetical protein
VFSDYWWRDARFNRPDCKTCSSVGIGHEAPHSCGRHRPSIGRLQFGAGNRCPAIGAGADADGFRRIARLTIITRIGVPFSAGQGRYVKRCPWRLLTNLASLENGGSCHNPSGLPRAVVVFPDLALAGCGKSRFIGPRFGVQSALRDEMWGTSRCAVGICEATFCSLM